MLCRYDNTKSDNIGLEINVGMWATPVYNDSYTLQSIY